MNLYKRQFLEDTLKDYYGRASKEAQKELKKFIIQKGDKYIIVNNKIYKCIKYNELYHIVLNIETNKKKYIAWSVIWNLENFTLDEAKEEIKKQLGTYHNINYKMQFEAGYLPYDIKLIKPF